MKIKVIIKFQKFANIKIYFKKLILKNLKNYIRSNNRHFRDP